MFAFRAMNAPAITANSLAGRTRYQSSGCVNVGLFLCETTPFEPSHAAAMVESLQTGSARALAALCATPPYTTVRNTTLAVDYCPSLKEGRAQDCPVFYVVLRAKRRDGFWEVALRKRRGYGLLSSKRKKRTCQLAAAIQEMRESGSGGYS
jgi:hypothetical protein